MNLIVFKNKKFSSDVLSST